MIQSVCDEKELSPAEYQQLLHDGLSKEYFIYIVKNVAEMSVKDFAVIAGVSQRTLSRLQPQQAIPSQATEVTLSALRTYQKACDIFGNKERAQEWMKRPNSALNSRTPLESLKTRFGAEEVLDVLSRIEYGVYS